MIGKKRFFLNLYAKLKPLLHKNACEQNINGHHLMNPAQLLERLTDSRELMISGHT